MYKIMENTFIFIFPVLLLILMTSTKGQIPPEKVPPELKFVLDPDLDKWEPPEEMKNRCPYYLSGFDEENRPIWVVELGVFPASELLAKGPEWEEAYNKYLMQMMKRGFDSLKFRATPENPVTECIMLIDMDKFLLKNILTVTALRVVTGQFKLIAKLATFTDKAFLLNTNFFAERALNLLRPILGGAMEKVEVYGTNSKVWIPKLLKVLPRNQLSERYGGDKGFTPVQVYG